MSAFAVSPAHVLIVGNTPQGQSPAALILRSEGYIVTTAATAKDALERMKEMMPDLVLVEPSTHGGCSELQEYLREWRCQVPLVLMPTQDRARPEAEHGYDDGDAIGLDAQALIQVVARLALN